MVESMRAVGFRTIRLSIIFETVVTDFVQNNFLCNDRKRKLIVGFRAAAEGSQLSLNSAGI